MALRLAVNLLSVFVVHGLVPGHEYYQAKAECCSYQKWLRHSSLKVAYVGVPAKMDCSYWGDANACCKELDSRAILLL